MMINDFFPIRDRFHADPYHYGFTDRPSGRGNCLPSPVTGWSDTNTSVPDRSRERIIPIQVEGRDFPTTLQHIDLTNDVSDANFNNSGLHYQSRNRRRHLANIEHTNKGAGKSQSTVSSFPVTRGTVFPQSQIPRDDSRSVSSHSSVLSDIIDLCMYEDLCDSADECISDKENSVSNVPCSKSKSSLRTNSDGRQTDSNQSHHNVEGKDITRTPSYPVYRYLKSQLARDGRLIDYIRGDGNCFFRALSKEIYGSEEFHDDVRQAVVDLTEKYSKEFEQFLDCGISISDHIKEMRKSSTWASSTEIYAAATLLQRDIYVLSPNHTGNSYHWMLFKPRFIYTRDTSYHPCFITLCHTHGNHYDRITPREGSCNCDYEPPVLSGVHAYVDLTN